MHGIRYFVDGENALHKFAWFIIKLYIEKNLIKSKFSSDLFQGLSLWDALAHFLPILLLTLGCEYHCGNNDFSSLLDSFLVSKKHFNRQK